MDTATTLHAPRSALLEIAGLIFSAESPGLAEAIAGAYHEQTRPRCLCQAQGVEMYVARLADGYVVKRMPDTGSHHAPSCASYEPAAAESGLEPLLGTAIIEDPVSGTTTIRLDFPLSMEPGRPSPPRLSARGGTIRNQGTRLSLRSLLHFLWDQAGLTRWRPGFEGRRSWGTVRRLLMQAAEQKIACGATLASRLYVPEMFSIDKKEDIASRRRQLWASAARKPNRAQQLLLLIAQVKELVPGRHGYKTVLKHIPDIAFAMDETLYHRVETRFADQLALWNAVDDIHMVVIAAFGLNELGLPLMSGLYLMTTTRQWLPIESALEYQLIDQLVHKQRVFTKLLRYDLRSEMKLPCVAMTDVGDEPQWLFAGEDIEIPTRGGNGIAPQDLTSQFSASVNAEPMSS